jgi:CRISPR-associated protein Csn2
MRKIVHRFIEKQIILDQGKITNLVLENPRVYFQFISCLKDQINGICDGDLVYSENDKMIDLKQKNILICDLFALEMTDKKIVAGLYKYILSQLSEHDIENEYNSLNVQINIFLRMIKDSMPLNISYDDEIDLLSLLKLSNVGLSYEKGTFIDSFVTFLKTVNVLRGYDVFWTLNLHSFLSQEDIALLIKEINLLHFNIINIEAFQHNSSIKYENVIVIDQDLCEYYK